MKMMKWLVYIMLPVFLLGNISISGQTKTQLKNKKKKLQNDINYTNSLLKKNKAKQDASLNQIEKINVNIEQRTELIQNYAEEVNLLDAEIHTNQHQITELEGQLTTLKKSYSKMVFYSWKNRNNFTQWMYILSSKNFNQGLRRFKYFKQINELRIVQARSIGNNKTELLTRIGQLKISRLEKEGAIKEKNNELASLEIEKKEKNDVVKKLKKKEKDLLKQVKQKELERDALTKKINAIADVVNKEIKKDKKTTTKTTTGTKTKTTTNSNTTVTNTSGSSNSNGFEANKGKLSWPVEKGIITGKYGVYAHPVLDKVEVKNDGIDISTDKGASVRAVYKGSVSGVFKVDGFENVVILRHGDYLTVYSHLTNVLVKKGDQVTTEQRIGTVATNDEGKSFMNFQVRYGSAVQNPNSWLVK